MNSAKPNDSLLGLAVLNELHDFLGRARANQVIDCALGDSIAQWFVVERATAGANEIMKLKPTERFVHLLAASGAFQNQGDAIEWPAWSQGTDGVRFRGIEVFPGEIIIETHAGISIADGETGVKRVETEPAAQTEG